MNIDGLAVGGGGVAGLRTGAGVSGVDCHRVALVSGSTAMLRPRGTRLAVRPVKGFSITLPIVDVGRSPESTLVAEASEVAVHRLRDRICAGAMAQRSGLELRRDEDRRRTPERVATGRFPSPGEVKAAQVLDRAEAHDPGWHGLRRPDPAPEPEACHRSRHSRQDHGRRQRTTAG